MGSRFLYSVVPGQPLVVAAVDGVLANDEDGDGQPLTAYLVQEPDRGSLELSSNGAFVYTPEPGFLGSDRFLYRASDGVLESRDTMVQLGVGNEAWDSRFGSPRLKEQWVTTLALGPSGELFAGGTFTAGYGSDSFPHGVARWDGNAWSSLGSGPGNGTSANVDALLWWRDRLFVGGVIGEAGGRAAPGIAQWDGHGWTAPGGGVLGRVYALARDSSGYERAFVLQDGQMLNLGTFAESFTSTASTAFAVNSAGVTVGSAETAGRVPHAFRYADGIMENLTTFGGIESVATGINDQGEIVGFALLGPGNVQAFRLPATGPVQFLGTLGGATSHAHGVSPSGLIVGNADDARGHNKAFLNYSGFMVDLGTLGGTESQARAINRYDQIVGSSRNFYNDQRAFLWHGTVMLDLNLLIPPDSGITLIEALDINDAGQIVGYGFSDIPNRRAHAVLLSPAADSPVQPRDGQLLRYAGGRFYLALPVPMGRAFVLEASLDLVAWIPVSTNYNRTGLIEFEDHAAGQSSTRFYRAVPLP